MCDSNLRIKVRSSGKIEEKMPTIRTYKLLILILVQSAWNALLSKVEYNILMENLRSKSHHTKAFLKRFFTRSIYLRGPTRSFNPFVRQAKSNEIEVVPKDFTSVCSGMLRNPSDKCILDDADSELTNIGPQNQLISPRSSSKLSWSDIKSCDECSVSFDALRPDSSRSNTKIRAKPIVRMSVCGHVFHTACIKAWMVSGGPNCPNCRSSQQKLMLRMRLATG